MHRCAVFGLCDDVDSRSLGLSIDKKEAVMKQFLFCYLFTCLSVFFKCSDLSGIVLIFVSVLHLSCFQAL